MKSNACRLFMYACLLSLPAIILGSCKKSTGSPPDSNTDTPGEFFLTAKVDGKDWSANVKDGDYDVSGGTSGQSLIILGVRAEGKDSTAIMLIFPRNPSVNVTKAFDPLQQSVAGYVTTSASYLGDPAVNGSGTYSITSINDSSKVVEGIFNFKAMLLKGTGNNSVTVTDGKFKAVYRTNYSPVFPSNLKR